MNKKFLGLRTTIYRVPDLVKATQWYGQVFNIKPYYEDDSYIGFNINGFELGLILEVDDSMKGDNILSYWGVEDIETVYYKLLKAGASAYEKPHNVGGEIVVAAVADPWKNIIGIIYNPTFDLS